MTRWSRTEILLAVISLVKETVGSPCECLPLPQSQYFASSDQTTLSCHCDHLQLTYIPDWLANASAQVHTLSLTNGNLAGIKKGSLYPYKDTLTDLSIARMKRFYFVECGVFENFPKLRYLHVVHTALSQLPKLRELGFDQPMHIIDFESNLIQSLFPNNVRVRTEQLFLDYNQIKVVDNWAFNGSEIGKLSLKGNKRLDELSINAFNGVTSLRELDLSETSIVQLPTAGLQGLESVRLVNTFSLTTIPSIYDLQSLSEAWLTYSFHCCAFQFPARHNPERHQAYLRSVKQCEQTQRHKRSVDVGGFGDDFYPADHLNLSHQSMGHGIDHEEDMGFHNGSAEIVKKVDARCGSISERPKVACWPKPDALNPCEDMMSWAWLRVSVWVVLTTAILGNTSVLIVLGFSSTPLSVPRFLMMNLALADFCMALYLLLLATMDLVSTQVYFNYAFHWQTGLGCKIAGFLTVFASQLSLFTLSLLTFERWFTIRHALYSNRMSLKVAASIMVVGWVYALLMAMLPLTGISSYSNTSICLPIDNKSTSSLVYILVLLSTAGLAFFLICICYSQIYLSLSYETRNRNEGAIAHKMTLLVVTNFTCWAPIAFFSLTAAAGYPLINVTQSKILLVFIYPINSCANPYLYAILTKQFRKDFLAILSRIGLCINLSHKYKAVYSRPGATDSSLRVTTAQVTA